MTTDTTDVLSLALSLCRGRYQRAYVRGDQRCSGSDLRGKAAKWGAAYARSRASIENRLTAAGIPWERAVPEGSRAKYLSLLSVA